MTFHFKINYIYSSFSCFIVIYEEEKTIYLKNFILCKGV